MTATAEDKIITDTEFDEATGAVLGEPTDGQAPGPAGQQSPVETPEPAAEPAVALRIVKGNPSDEEVAALVSVLAAAAASVAPEGDGSPRETWGDPTRMHRQWAPFSPYSYPNRV
ncbi:acyl-CoA carboxylase epsilon subunit [Rhodococcus sp. NPDC058639]|uniref:acyl-CoA carboxylase epsilon subunit n=1 Tax=Rhodococcus sp. NPDC058639 TaxID=3346570 RepID=UPI00364DCA12